MIFGVLGDVEFIAPYGFPGSVAGDGVDVDDFAGDVVGGARDLVDGGPGLDELDFVGGEGVGESDGGAGRAKVDRWSGRRRLARKRKFGRTNDEFRASRIRDHHFRRLDDAALR